MNADLILCNLSVLGVGSAGLAERLIAIRGNRILYVGTHDRLSDLQGRRTRVIDCHGGLAIPGFNDAHCHPLAFALTLMHVDCSAPRVRCIADLQALLSQKAAETRSERWIRGANYEVAALAEGRAPNRWELDQAVPHRPVVLIERSGHHCVLNSRALTLCGIGESARSTDAGQIHRDPVRGCPNGIVSGNHRQVARAIPALDQNEIEAGLREANRTYLAHGITSLQDTGWSNTYGHWQAMSGYKERGLLTPRLTLFAGFDALAEFASRGMRTGSGDGRLRLGAAKIALDESSGTPEPPQDALNEAALAAHLAGFQLAFHVPDICLLQRSLQALEFVQRVAPRPCVRPRFEHCPACPPALLPALAGSGATVIAQPNLLALAGPGYLQQVPADQWTWIHPYGSFLAHGIPVAFGSDSPLTGYSPLEAIRTAVTRKVANGGILGAGEAIPMSTAIRLYSEAGAMASREEREKGKLLPGQLADVVLLDPAADGRPQDRVRLTLIDGEVVWHE